MLGELPVFWVVNPAYLLVCGVVAVIVFFTAPLVESRYRLLLWFDALGLSAYCVMGAAKGLAVAASPLVAIVTGIMTATFGGILRDLLAGEPSVLLRPEIYVTAALGGLCRGLCGTRRGAALRLGVSALSQPPGPPPGGHSVVYDRSRYSKPDCWAASRRFFCGRGPICWMTMPAASDPRRPQSTRSRPVT